MAGIPVYEKRQSPSANTIGVTRVNMDQGGLVNLGQGLQSAGANLSAVAQLDNRKAEETDLLTASNALSSGDEFWNQRSTEMKQGYTVGGEDLRKTSKPEFDKWKTEQLAALKTDKAKSFFSQHAEKLRSSLNQNFYNYQDQQATDKVATDTKLGMEQDFQIIAQSPERLQDVTERRLAVLNAQSRFPEAKRTEIGNRYKQEAAKAAEQGVMFRNPKAWLDDRLVPQEAGGATGGDIFETGIIGQESGGKQFGKDGKPLTSSAGAVGIAQVMPGTGPEAAALAGLPWDEDKFKNDANYNKELGRAYYNKQLQTFGNPAMAAAAYNAGPGAVQKAVKEGGANWLSHLPKETQDYVPAVMGRSGQSAATGPGVEREIWADAPESFKALDYTTQQQMIITAQNQVRSQQAQQRASADQLMVDVNDMHKDGRVDPFNLTPEYFTNAYGAADGVTRYAEYEAGRTMASDIDSFASMTDQQIIANLNTTKPVEGEGYAVADARQSVKAAAAAQVYKARQDDPQTFAMQQGLSDTQPLDMSKPDTIAPELTKRIGTAQMMNENYGTPYQVLMKGEASQFSAVLRTMPTQQKLAYLDQVRTGTLSDQRAYMSIMTQIAADSPVTAIAGSLLTRTQPATIPGGWLGSDIQLQPRDVAATILEGEAILNPNKADKEQDGRGGKFPMPKEIDLQMAFNDTVGAAFRGDAKGYETAYQAFKSYYAGKSSRDGVLADSLDSRRAKEAAFAVTGGVADFNGNGEVLKPWGMAEDQFKDRVSKSFNEQMQAAGLKGSGMDDLSAYGLQSIGEGKYLVTNGANYLNGPQGPIMLTVSVPTTGAGVTQ
jgi:GH24 family phage-related lysozyme (muramidase)